LAKRDVDSYLGGFDYALQLELEEELRGLKESLCASAASDFAEYKFLCGQILGIRNAIEAIIKLRERIQREE
jgi:hypothetical protein